MSDPIPFAKSATDLKLQQCLAAASGKASLPADEKEECEKDFGSALKKIRRLEAEIELADKGLQVYAQGSVDRLWREHDLRNQLAAARARLASLTPLDRRPVPNSWRFHLQGFFQTGALDLRGGSSASYGGGGEMEILYRPDRARYTLGMDFLYAYAQARSKEPRSGFFPMVDWRKEELYQVLTGFSLMTYPMEYLSVGLALRGGYGFGQTRYDIPFPNASDHPTRAGFTGELALRMSLSVFTAVVSAEAGAATYAGPSGRDAALFARLGAGWYF